MFHKGSASRDAIKYVVVAGACVAVIGYFAGPGPTAIAANNAVGGTAWGVGVLGGTAKQVGPGFKAGFDQSDGAGDAFTQTVPEVKAKAPATPKKDKAKKDKAKP